MDGLWSCPVCGSRGRHYNRTRLAMVCDQCGRAIPDPEQDRQRQQYDRAMHQAREHLQVGNWEQCRSAVQPWLDRYPAEKLTYQLLLAACTKGYTDMLLADQTALAQARSCWEKLSALRGINMLMNAYAARRVYARKQQLKRIQTLILAAAALSGGMVLVAGLLQSGLLLLAALLGAVVLLHKLWQKYDPIGTAQALRRITSGQIRNPFDA